MKIDGGCHCGYIAYEAEVDPEQTAICHCTDCQTLSGSSFRTVVPAPDHSFRNPVRGARDLRQNRGKRCKAPARLLPPMRFADLLDSRR